ncbi:MAG: hypothetical protein ACJAZX_001304 [Rickettsiales bacterium]|jgi:hypothetical protein
MGSVPSKAENQKDKNKSKESSNSIEDDFLIVPNKNDGLEVQSMSLSEYDAVKNDQKKKNESLNNHKKEVLDMKSTLVIVSRTPSPELSPKSGAKKLEPLDKSLNLD